MPDNDLTEEKDEEKAISYRQEANEQYKKKNFLSALELYNKALCYSPPGSPNLGLTFGSN